MDSQCDFGMVGLGTMGRNLLLNIVDHGAVVAGLDMSQAQADTLMQAAGEGKAFATTDPKAFVASLKTPRAIMILVPAGAPVDAVIGELTPLLEKGDILIDGGNSYFKDTIRRGNDLTQLGLEFLGIGISGGESGARHGPAMMAGGSEQAWSRVAPFLSSVAAQYDGEPCAALMGPGGAGHYVKMIHNGIEYGLMQLIAEAYDLLKRGCGKSNEQIQAIFERWDEGELKSFLIEITATVLAKKEGDAYLVDVISDKAKQKGTGKWTSQDAMDLGIPIPTIDAAVTARELSSLREERVKFSGVNPQRTDPVGRGDLFAVQLEDALIAAFWLTYIQGFAQLESASAEYDFDLNLQTVAKDWRAGCIIRSSIIESISGLVHTGNLLLNEEVLAGLRPKLDELRQVVAVAATNAIPAPCLAASLGYFDSYASPRLPANLIQAQRDYFGAHGYERLDKAGQFHTPNWGPDAE